MIRSGAAGGGQRGLKDGLVDSRWIERPGARRLGEFSRGVGDVGASAVIERDLQLEPIVVRRAALRTLE